MQLWLILFTLFILLLSDTCTAEGPKHPSVIDDKPPSQGLNKQEKQHTKHHENSWLLMCDMIHSNHLVVDASVAPSGCQLKCVVLESSSEETKEYYDKSVTHYHTLNDGIYCKRDHVCHKGECVLDVTDNRVPGGNSGGPSRQSSEKRGLVVIDVIDGYIPQKDTMTQSDTYVKVMLKDPSRLLPNRTITSKVSETEDVKVGTTKTIWDTSYPTFKETFKVENVSISSTIFFEIFDRDLMGPDDYIATVYAGVKKILRDEQNNRDVRLSFLKDYWLRIKLSWLSYEHW